MSSKLYPSKHPVLVFQNWRKVGEDHWSFADEPDPMMSVPGMKLRTSVKFQSSRCFYMFSTKEVFNVFVSNSFCSTILSKWCLVLVVRESKH